ncbi:MAG: aminoacyl-histidine dipeptidase [Lachnospiraceae bacterium]|nr:aminoacyl-histidine dipeptidase [Lachnospiraceae bacterium]
MAVLTGLEPQNVWTFFEELCAIPHGSGNLQAISDHLVSFAKERNLEVIQDETLNVIIKKKGTPGYEDKPPVILQGHMDMVAVCTPESGIDMTVTPLALYTEGDHVRAKDTSLGGDDGIAVAMCMAILDAGDLPHPPLEVVITTEEETGMDGARALDASVLSGKRFINLDSEDEGVFMVGCAGGARFHARYLYEKVKRSGTKVSLTVGGLKGGHSGVMIHEERGNANVLLARILYTLYRKLGQDFSLCTLNGGVADNAIPSNASAVIVLPSDNPLADFEAALNSIRDEIAKELATRDPGFTVTLADLGRGTFESFDESSMKHAIKLILSLPNGVQAMSPDVKGLVETSLNLGVMQTDEKAQTLQLSYAVRSSVESAKNHLNDRLRMIAKSFGAVTEVQGSYPGWQYAKESPLRDLMVRVFEKMYGKSPTVEAIHAGVECGFFAAKIPGLDCISIGPDMQEIHSTGEALSIPSTKRVYEFVCEVLKEM